MFKSRQNFTYLYEKVINTLRQTKPEISKKRAFVLHEIIRKNRLFFRRDSRFLKTSLPRKTVTADRRRFAPTPMLFVCAGDRRHASILGAPTFAMGGLSGEAHRS